MHEFDKAVLIAVFCLFIFAPLAAGIIQEDKVSSGIEKRNCASSRLSRSPWRP
jgi:hypothetical protein